MAQASQGDLFMCKESAVSKFAQVKRSKVVHLDIQPFLTRSQLDSGVDSTWFKLSHLQELLALLKDHLEVYLSTEEENTGAKKKSVKKAEKEFVLTGTLVRAACSFRTQAESNVYLVGKTYLPINTRSVQEKKYSWNQVMVHPEKLVCFICPRSNSSMLQLSQIVNTSMNREHEDISKYFQQPAS